jgi:hypothetical protein
VDELHRDVPDAGVLAAVVDRDDIGMRQPARRLRFAAKAREDFLRVAAGQLIRPDGLERDDALDQRIEGIVHDAHRAAPQLAPDLILPKFRKFRHQLFPSQPNAGRGAHRRLSACICARYRTAREARL